jgi:predicted CoA-binding protein
LKELQKMTKKIDLVKLFEKINSSGKNMPSGLSKSEKDFYQQYRVYQKKEKGLDSNYNTIVVEGNDYYNAVFDFLV